MELSTLSSFFVTAFCSTALAYNFVGHASVIDGDMLDITIEKPTSRLGHRAALSATAFLARGRLARSYQEQ